MNTNPKKQMVVMSPDRFFCAGMTSVLQSRFKQINLLPACHSLHELRLLLENNEVQFIITVTCGVNESLVDWIEFSQWFAGKNLSTQVILFCRPELNFLLTQHNTLFHLIDPRTSVQTLSSLLETSITPVSAGNPERVTKPIQKSLMLTSAESKVIQLIWQGFSGNEAASLLGVHFCTISAHKRNAMKKLGMTNVVSLMKLGAWGHNDKRLLANVVRQKYSSVARICVEEVSVPRADVVNEYL